MQGHSAANMIPVIASNRVGSESGDRYTITFYGSSFITDGTGGIIVQANRTDTTFITAELNLTRILHSFEAVDNAV
jgi:N-carbamoylputrescine amidase